MSVKEDVAEIYLPAFGSGLYKGFLKISPRGKLQCPEKHEAVRGYFRLGYVAGYVLKILLIVTFGPKVIAF